MQIDYETAAMGKVRFDTGERVGTLLGVAHGRGADTRIKFNTAS